MSHTTTVIAEGLAFPEAPRWHGGRLWFTDQHGHRVYALSPTGELAVVAETPDLPGGLGWLPDGTPLVVLMTRRQVVALEDGRLRPHGDLHHLASFHCNDMLVDPLGRAYVGNFGYDLHGGARPAPAELILVHPEGLASVVARDLVFPNGCALTPDGSTLLVAETFAQRVSAFTVAQDGTLHGRRVWAELGDASPDGITLDAGGCLWLAAPNRGEVLRVAAGGEVLATVRTVGAPYACALGGDDRRTLYICTSESDDPAEAAARRSGRIEAMAVEVPGDGLP